MTYGNSWVGLAIKHEYREFVEHQVLNAKLQKIKSLRFEARDLLEKYINEFIVTRTTVVNQTTRFPKKVQVNVTDGVIPLLVSKIQATFHESLIESFSPKSARFIELEYLFHKNIHRLQKILLTARSDTGVTYGIFDRDYFERHYQLKWVSEPSAGQEGV